MTNDTFRNIEEAEAASKALESATAEIEQLRRDNKSLANAAVERPPYKSELIAQIEQLSEALLGVSACGIQQSNGQYLVNSKAFKKVLEACKPYLTTKECDHRWLHDQRPLTNKANRCVLCGLPKDTEKDDNNFPKLIPGQDF
jgi:uncharacterized membrane protein YgaE (UPF0421/DUF939 family)